MTNLPNNGTATAQGMDRAAKKAMHYVTHGNKGKGWRAFGETSVVPPQEAAGSLTALTPQVPRPPRSSWPISPALRSTN